MFFNKRGLYQTVVRFVLWTIFLLRMIVQKYGKVFIYKIKIVKNRYEFQKSPEHYFRLELRKKLSHKAQFNLCISYKNNVIVLIMTNIICQ